MTGKQPKVLVVDDEAAMREVLEMRLTGWGYSVRLAGTGEEARAAGDDFAPDLVISDVALPDLSGLELLPDLLGPEGARPVILITAYGTIDTAVEAMKSGAHDFLTKPLDYGKLKLVLEQACGEIARRSEARQLETALEEGVGLGSLIGAAKPMREVFELLEVLAGNDAPAILSGESGTGKELAARTIHDRSRRAAGPFVAVNAAAIPEGITESLLFGHEKGTFTGAAGSRAGYFELARGGTLFLDEISEMPAALQPKLLRVLEDGRVRRLGGSRETDADVRLLAATNRDPKAALADGKLRQDLYYRLSVFTVELPPLRVRRSDIPLLAQHFVREFNGKHETAVEGVASEAMELLQGYGWPGNVRELRNVAERAVILARRGWIETVHLPPFVREPEGSLHSGIVVPLGTTAAEAEKRLILETLKRLDGNKSRAARTLGLDVKTIRNKLRAWQGESGTR